MLLNGFSSSMNLVSLLLLPVRQSQVLLDLLAQFSSSGVKPLYEDMSCKEIYSIEAKEWQITCDGSFAD